LSYDENSRKMTRGKDLKPHGSSSANLTTTTFESYYGENIYECGMIAEHEKQGERTP
jgi:hypothetical protein